VISKILPPLPIVLAMLAIACTGGCTNQEILDQAKTLAKDIRIYRQAQAERIDRLNSEYRAAFDENMDELVRLSDTELTQARDVDAQSLADQLIDGDKATYIGSLRARLGQSVSTQRKAIDAADENIAVARKAYLDSYHQAKLQLSKLDQLQADLAILAEREDALRVTGTVIQKLVENYRQIKDEQQKDPKATNAGGANKP
jgi:hypothetical protein